MRGDSVEEILRKLEYKNSTIRVIKSEKYPMVRVMAYMPLAEFSFGLFDRKSTDLSDEALKTMLDSKHLLITQLDADKCNRIKWLTEAAFATVIDDGTPLCIKNRFGDRSIYDCDKSKFEIINVNDILGNGISDIHTIYYGKNMWIQM